MDRRTVTIPRSWAVSVVMGAFFVAGALIMVGLSMLRQGEDVASLVQSQRRADIRAEADTKAATVAARARVSEALEEVRRILEDSIVAHDAQAQSDHDAQMARLAQLLGRPAPVSAPRLVPRPAPPSPARTVAPRAGGSPVAPPTTAAAKPPPVRANPPATPTTCPTRGKSEKCR